MRDALRIAPAVLFAVSACSVSPEDAELEDIEIIGLNGLSPDALLQNGDALQALAGSALNGASTELTESDAGQELLFDLVRCALRAGQTASFPRQSGPDLVLTGHYGIAPGWRQGGLNENGQRFVTACLMAHVNGLGTSFPISVRSSALGSAGLLEPLLFPAQEMAVFGNFFAPASQRELNVCFGQAVAQTLGGSGGIGGALGLPSYLDFRFCSVSDGCGFNRVGACFRWQADVTRSACQTRNGDLYRRCHNTPIEVGSSPSWDQTVSVYLQPLDLAILLTGYADFICQLANICIDLDL